MLLISIELLITPCEYADLGCPHGRIASESVHTCINCESTLTIYVQYIKFPISWKSDHH